MLTPDNLYITEYREFFADLYRNGNSTHPRFDHLRPGHDAQIYDVSGIPWIRANGNGISAFTDYDKTKKNWWKIPKGLLLPPALRIVKDLRAGFETHFMIAPSHDMSLAEYMTAMDSLRPKCIKVL